MADFESRVKVLMYIQEDAAAWIRSEAAARGVTIGYLVHEALVSQMRALGRADIPQPVASRPGPRAASGRPR